MAKILFFDVETTGLHFGNDSIHQMAGILEINGVEVNRFDIRMRPKNFDSLPDDYVTPVGEITKQMMLSYGTQRDGFGVLKKLLDKHVSRFDKTDKLSMAGYNSQAFDNIFLRQLFADHGDNFFGAYFWSATLDIMILAADKLIEERPKMPNFKLETVVNHFGLSVAGEGFHDALSDIEVTRNLYHILKVS